MRSCIVRPFYGLPILAPPWRARGAVHVGGGLCAPSGASVSAVIRLSSLVKRGGFGPWGCGVDVSCLCTGEIRLNLTTPLWPRPFSVADIVAGRAQHGRKRQRHALSLPASGSDRAGPCPAPVSGVSRPNGRETLPNPPRGPLRASGLPASQQGTCNPRTPAYAALKAAAALPH